MSADEGSGKFQEEWGYADAVAVGNSIFLSGVVASLRPGETDLNLAYTRAFDTIAQSLHRLGCNWGGVPKLGDTSARVTNVHAHNDEGHRWLAF